MRNALTFLYGAIFGAFGLMLYLQQSGQLELHSATATPVASSEVARVKTAPEPIEREKIASLAPVRLGPRSIAIPVVGIEREDLEPTFDAQRGSRRHGAIDILAPRGTPVVAAIDGTILKLFESIAGGQTIYLSDPNGKRVYYYAHLDDYAPGLTEGQSVSRGRVIGYVGTTGNAPKNTPHLHFAIENLPPTGEWWMGDPIDPYPILMRDGVKVVLR